ncbi:MAG: spore coat U domain-containing protein [Nevskia sp.]|nr:spore coat U domain-containing protein [Nevskia sp.]
MKQSKPTGSRLSSRLASRAGVAAFLALAGLSFDAAASTTTTTFLVQVTLTSSCSISASTLNFGSSVGLLTSAVNGSTTVNVTCSNTTPYNVGLDAGTVTGSTVSTRLMAGTTTGNTSTTMSFQLYSDSGHGTVWGNTVGTNTVSGTGNGGAQAINVYGQVPVQTTPVPDTYQTTVTATVTY